MVDFTIDTHRAFTNKDDQEKAVDEFARVLDEEALTVRGLGMLILFRDPNGEPCHSPRSIRSVDIPRIGMEVGRKYGRLHAHGRLLILHECHVNIGPMQKYWTEWFRHRMDWAPSLTVKLVLGNTVAMNYTLKDPEGLHKVSVYDR